MDPDIISSISFIKSSKYRQQILLLLNNNILTPAEIQQNLGLRINHVSFYLHELKEAGIVICLNEDAKKGRLYQLSELGNEVCSYIRTK